MDFIIDRDTIRRIKDPFLLKLWIYCLDKAVPEERIEIVGKTIINLKPGQFLTDRSTLASEYNEGLRKEVKVNERTLWRWLNILKDAGFLSLITTNRYTIIQVNGYEKFCPAKNSSFVQQNEPSNPPVERVSDEIELGFVQQKNVILSNTCPTGQKIDENSKNACPAKNSSFVQQNEPSNPPVERVSGENELDFVQQKMRVLSNRCPAKNASFVQQNRPENSLVERTPDENELSCVQQKIESLSNSVKNSGHEIPDVYNITLNKNNLNSSCIDSSSCNRLKDNKSGSRNEYGTNNDNGTCNENGINDKLNSDNSLENLITTGEKQKTKKYKFDEVHMELAQFLLSEIRKNYASFKEPNLKMWANEFRLMMERDKRLETDIRKLIEWTQKDSFWHRNILSPANLRKHFDRLIMQMEEDEEKGNGGYRYGRGKKSNNRDVRSDLSKYDFYKQQDL